MSSPEHPVIAIDGPAASGKSSVAKALARQFGFAFVGSGTLYRALSWGLLEMKVEVADVAAVRAAFPWAGLSAGLENGFSWVAIHDRRLVDELESAEVNAAVSAVSKVPELREFVVARLRAFREDGPLVMEGRDIASVVFPGTPWKFFIDASAEVRQRRRTAQGLRDSVTDRDRIDSSRRSAPLRLVDDAVVVDSSHLGIDEVVSAILDNLRQRQAPFALSA